MKYKYLFRVEGTGTFPFDMLRYDACWPARGTDVINLAWASSWSPVILLLQSHRKPTADRWASFGWTVDIVSP